MIRSRDKKQSRIPELCLLTMSPVLVLAFLLMLVVAIVPAAPAQTLTVLHAFVGSDGANPNGGLIFDQDGNLYGTTSGNKNFRVCGTTCGTIFKIDPAGNFTTLYTFTGGKDGGMPWGWLIRTDAGMLYGTTSLGGAYGHGAVFKFLRTGKEAVIYSFKGGTDGDTPYAGLTRDAAGNLYGTTYFGGKGSGTVFKIDNLGHESILYSFGGGTDGYQPNGVIRDPAGNLFGTTQYGGVGTDCGFSSCGTVFKLDPSNNHTVMHSFGTVKEGGGEPGTARVIHDTTRESLYGTAFLGGDPTCHFSPDTGCGVLFKLTQAGGYAVLHTFHDDTDGYYPTGSLIWDSQGNLWGTNQRGANTACAGFGGNGIGCGTIFKLDKNHILTTIYTFTGGADGGNPRGPLVMDSQGNFYGITLQGGDPACNCGVVFKLTP